MTDNVDTSFEARRRAAAAGETERRLGYAVEAAKIELRDGMPDGSEAVVIAIVADEATGRTSMVVGELRRENSGARLREAVERWLDEEAKGR